MMEYDIQSNEPSESMRFNNLKPDSISFKNSGDDQTWTLKLDPDTFNNQDMNNDEENDTFTEKFVKHLDKLKEERDGIKSPSDKKLNMLSRTNSSPMAQNNNSSNNKNYDKSRTKTPDVIMMKNINSSNTDVESDQFFDGNNNPTFPCPTSEGEKTVLLPNIGSLASTIGYENGTPAPSTSDANNNNTTNDQSSINNENSGSNNNAISSTQNSIPAHYLIPCSSPGISRPPNISTESRLTTMNPVNQSNSLINPITESLVNANTSNLAAYQTNQYSQLLLQDQNAFSTDPNLIPATSVQLNNLLNLTGVIGSQNNQFSQFSSPNIYRNSDANNNGLVFSNNQQDATLQLRLQGVSLTNGNQTTEMLFPNNNVSNLNHIIVSSPSAIGNQFLNGPNGQKIPDILTLHQNPYLANNIPNNNKHETIRVQMTSSPDPSSNKKPRISRTVLAAQVLMDQHPDNNNNGNRKSKTDSKESKSAKKGKVKDAQVAVECNSFHDYSNMGSDSDDLSSYGCHLPPDADPSLIKLEKKRARNRVAARRCRERKLSLIQSLEAEVGELKHIISSLREQKDRFIEVITTSVHQLNRFAETMPHLRDEINRIPLMSADSLKFEVQHQNQQTVPSHHHRPPLTPNNNGLKRDMSQLNSSFEG